MADPLDVPKYRNAAHALYTVVKEEGVGALYRGISLTALRQGMFASFHFLCLRSIERFWGLEALSRKPRERFLEAGKMMGNCSK